MSAGLTELRMTHYINERVEEVPGWILNRGPEYLRSRMMNRDSALFRHNRRSAVELLAETKPLYVRSPDGSDSKKTEHSNSLDKAGLPRSQTGYDAVDASLEPRRPAGTDTTTSQAVALGGKTDPTPDAAAGSSVSRTSRSAAGSWMLHPTSSPVSGGKFDLDTDARSRSTEEGNTATKPQPPPRQPLQPPHPPPRQPLQPPHPPPRQTPQPPHPPPRQTPCPQPDHQAHRPQHFNTPLQMVSTETSQAVSTASLQHPHTSFSVFTRTARNVDTMSPLLLPTSKLSMAMDSPSGNPTTVTRPTSSPTTVSTSRITLATVALDKAFSKHSSETPLTRECSSKETGGRLSPPSATPPRVPIKPQHLRNLQIRQRHPTSCSSVPHCAQDFATLDQSPHRVPPRGSHHRLPATPPRRSPLSGSSNKPAAHFPVTASTVIATTKDASPRLDDCHTAISHHHDNWQVTLSGSPVAMDTFQPSVRSHKHRHDRLADTNSRTSSVAETGDLTKVPALPNNREPTVTAPPPNQFNSHTSLPLSADNGTSHHVTAEVGQHHRKGSILCSGSDSSKLCSNGSEVSGPDLVVGEGSSGGELERFFNGMGLDRQVLEPLREHGSAKLQHAHSSSSLNLLESISCLGSGDDGARSCLSQDSLRSNSAGRHGVRGGIRGSGEAGARILGPAGSALERNARIIKWLCNIKSASSSSLHLASRPHPQNNNINSNKNSGNSNSNNSDNTSALELQA